MTRTQTRKVWLRLTYICCGMEWTDEWPAVLKMECPDCGVLVEAFEIVEMDGRKNPKAA